MAYTLPSTPCHFNSSIVGLWAAAMASSRVVSPDNNGQIEGGEVVFAPDGGFRHELIRSHH